MSSKEIRIKSKKEADLHSLYVLPLQNAFYVLFNVHFRKGSIFFFFQKISQLEAEWDEDEGESDE